MKIVFTLIVFWGLMPVIKPAGKMDETVYYHCKLANRVFILQLGTGYFAAKFITQQVNPTKKIVFAADTAVPDDQYQLTFHAKGRPDYFVLDDMQESFDTAPVIVEGRYWSGKKWLAVKFISGR